MVTGTTPTEERRRQSLPSDIRDVPAEEVEARQTIRAGQSIPRRGSGSGDTPSSTPSPTPSEAPKKIKAPKPEPVKVKRVSGRKSKGVQRQVRVQREREKRRKQRSRQIRGLTREAARARGRALTSQETRRLVRRAERPGGVTITRTAELTAQRRELLSTPDPEAFLLRTGAISTTSDQPGVVFATPQETGIAGARQRLGLQRRELTSQDTFRSNLAGFGIGIAVSGLSFVQAAKDLFTQPVETIKSTGRGIKEAGRKVVTGEGFPGVGRTLREEPGFAFGRVAGEVALLKGTQVVAIRGPALVRGTVTRFTPKFRGVRKVETTFGEERIIQDIPDIGGVGEIGIIPKATSGPKKIEGKPTPPTIRGGFGFSKAEQLAIEKNIDSGPSITAAKDLFGPIKKQVKLKPGLEREEFSLFATPAIEGRGFVRESFLGLDQQPARFIDIITGDISFRRQKPQIVVVKEGKGFKGIGFPSSELETTALPGKVIKKTGKPAVTVIKGERVPIFTAEIVDAEASAAEVFGKAVAGKKLTSAQKKALKKDTGFSAEDISSRDFPSARVSPRGILSRTPIRRATVRRGSSRAVSTRRSSRVSRLSRRRPSRSKVRTPVRRTTTRTTRSVARVTRTPTRPPTRTPTRPPTKPPTKPPAILKKAEKRKGKKREKKEQLFDVFARPVKRTKSDKKPELIKVNKRGALPKVRARDLRNYVLDTSLARTGTIKPSGSKRRIKLKRVPLGFAKATVNKFRKFRSVKGKRKSLPRNTVIERGTRLLDTSQEIRGITLRKRIAQVNRRRLPNLLN